MTRHPGTEGNDLKPRRVDCEQDVTVGGSSIADAASGVFIQSDEPTDPPNGARWTDTSTQPPRTKIYDDSSNAWIPINSGDRTFVQDTEPDDLLQGDIWFDTSPEDGTDMQWFDGSSLNFLQFIPSIPDSAVHQYDAQALVGFSDNETVNTLPDEIGGENATGQATYVESGINGNPSLDFNGTDDNFSTGQFDNIQQRLVVISVAASNDNAERQRLYDGVDNILALDHRWDDDPTEIELLASTSSRSAEGIDEEPHIFRADYNGSETELWQDGSLRFDDGVDPGDNALDGLTIGSTRTDAFWWDGQISELIVYDDPTQAEIDDEEQRLSDKWGISI